jgi:two-component system chemotaxis sensor kinase CheA
MAKNAGAQPARRRRAAPPAAAAGHGTIDEDELTSDFDLDAMLNDLAGPPLDRNAQAEPQGWQIHLRPRAGAMRNGGEPLLLLRELAALGATAAQCDTASVPVLDDFDPSRAIWAGPSACRRMCRSERARHLRLCGRGLPHRHRRGCRDARRPGGAGLASPAARPVPQPAAPQPRARPVAAVRRAAPAAAPWQAAPAPAPSRPPPRRRRPAAPRGQSIRIDLIKLDKLIDTVGELVIAQAMLVQRLQNENVQSSEELTLLESLTRDIQESAMSIRAQPIGSVFSRVPRILRELAASTGKHVNLQVFGETTELDKTVIERLGEPLTHLIRNAVDHGIEKPEDRLAGQERKAR